MTEAALQDATDSGHSWLLRGALQTALVQPNDADIRPRQEGRPDGTTSAEPRHHAPTRLRRAAETCLPRREDRTMARQLPEPKVIRIGNDAWTPGKRRDQFNFPPRHG